MRDIGVLASLDPVALDQACLDLVYRSDDPGRDHFIERVETRHGVHTIEAAEQLGVGSRDYELVALDCRTGGKYRKNCRRNRWLSNYPLFLVALSREIR